MTKNVTQEFIDALAACSATMAEYKAEYESDCDKFWNGLTNEQKLMAFYSVCQKIHKADVVDQGSYRWALYDVFGFGMESYGAGMDCGYMEIHNLIGAGIDADKKINTEGLELVSEKKLEI